MDVPSVHHGSDCNRAKPDAAMVARQWIKACYRVRRVQTFAAVHYDVFNRLNQDRSTSIRPIGIVKETVT